MFLSQVHYLRSCMFSLRNYHLISLDVSPSAIEERAAEMHYREQQKYVIRVNTGQHVD
jgi:hypothetical protein